MSGQASNISFAQVHEDMTQAEEVLRKGVISVISELRPTEIDEWKPVVEQLPIVELLKAASMFMSEAVIFINCVPPSARQQAAANFKGLVKTLEGKG